MVIIWAPNAKRNLRGIFDYYLDTAGRKIAERMVIQIHDTAHALGAMPFMASKERELSERNIYRSLVVNKMFKVIYRVDETKGLVEIVSVWDCRQDPAKMHKETDKV